MTSLLHTHDDAIRDTCGYRNADTKDWDCVRDSGPASICEDNSGNQMLPTSSVRIYVTFLKPFALKIAIGWLNELGSQKGKNKRK